MNCDDYGSLCNLGIVMLWFIMKFMNYYVMVHYAHVRVIICSVTHENFKVEPLRAEINGWIIGMGTL